VETSRKILANENLAAGLAHLLEVTRNVAMRAEATHMRTAVTLRIAHLKANLHTVHEAEKTCIVSKAGVQTRAATVIELVSRFKALFPAHLELENDLHSELYFILYRLKELITFATTGINVDAIPVGDIAPDHLRVATLFADELANHFIDGRLCHTALPTAGPLAGLMDQTDARALLVVLRRVGISIVANPALIRAMTQFQRVNRLDEHGIIIAAVLKQILKRLPAMRLPEAIDSFLAVPPSPVPYSLSI